MAENQVQNCCVVFSSLNSGNGLLPHPVAPSFSPAESVAPQRQPNKTHEDRN